MEKLNKKISFKVMRGAQTAGLLKPHSEFCVDCSRVIVNSEIFTFKSFNVSYINNISFSIFSVILVNGTLNSNQNLNNGNTNSRNSFVSEFNYFTNDEI